MSACDCCGQKKETQNYNFCNECNRKCNCNVRKSTEHWKRSRDRDDVEGNPHPHGHAAVAAPENRPYPAAPSATSRLTRNMISHARRDGDDDDDDNDEMGVGSREESNEFDMCMRCEQRNRSVRNRPLGYGSWANLCDECNTNRQGGGKKHGSKKGKSGSKKGKRSSKKGSNKKSQAGGKKRGSKKSSNKKGKSGSKKSSKRKSKK
jgi:hypothetical protein